MGENLCLLIRRAPFGSLHAAEGIRLANGEAAYGYKFTVVLVDDGVYLAKKDQRPEESGWTSLSDEVKKLSKWTRVCVHIDSLKSAGLDTENLVDGITKIDDQELTNIMAESDSTVVL